MVNEVGEHLEAWSPQVVGAVYHCTCGRHGRGLNLGIGYASPKSFLSSDPHSESLKTCFRQRCSRSTICCIHNGGKQHGDGEDGYHLPSDTGGRTLSVVMKRRSLSLAAVLLALPAFLFGTRIGRLILLGVAVYLYARLRPLP